MKNVLTHFSVIRDKMAISPSCPLDGRTARRSKNKKENERSGWEREKEEKREREREREMKRPEKKHVYRKQKAEKWIHPNRICDTALLHAVPSATRQILILKNGGTCERICLPSEPKNVDLTSSIERKTIDHGNIGIAEIVQAIVHQYLYFSGGGGCFWR